MSRFSESESSCSSSASSKQACPTQAMNTDMIPWLDNSGNNNNSNGNVKREINNVYCYIFDEIYIFGFIIIDGNGCLFGTIKIKFNNNSIISLTKEILYQFSVDLPTRHNKGGQSQNRMLRLNDEVKHNYIRKCCEYASNHFISNNKVAMDGIIIAGAGGIKNKFYDSNILDTRIKEKLITILTIGSVYKDGFNDAIKLSEPYLLQFNQDKEEAILDNFWFELDSMNNKTCFGINDTLYCLKSKLIDTLILCYQLQLNVITARNKKDRYQKLQLFVTDNEIKNNSTPTSRLINNIKYNNNGWGNDWYIVSSVNFISWIFNNDNCKQFGVKQTKIIGSNTRKSNEFYNNYSGIGGLLHLSIDLIQLNENDEKNNMDENGINCTDIGKTVWVIKEVKPNKQKEGNSSNDNKTKKTNVKQNNKVQTKKNKSPVKKTKASEASKKFLEFKRRKEEAKKAKQYVFASNVGKNVIGIDKEKAKANGDIDSGECGAIFAPAA